jgi:hypothetical protein
LLSGAAVLLLATAPVTGFAPSLSATAAGGFGVGNFVAT